MRDASCYNINGDSVVLMHILDGKGFTKLVKQYLPFPILKLALMIIFTKTDICKSQHYSCGNRPWLSML